MAEATAKTQECHVFRKINFITVFTQTNKCDASMQKKNTAPTPLPTLQEYLVGLGSTRAHTQAHTNQSQVT